MHSFSTIIKPVGNLLARHDAVAGQVIRFKLAHTAALADDFLKIVQVSDRG